MPSHLEDLVHSFRRGHILDLNGQAINAELIRDLFLGRLIGSGQPDPRGFRLLNAVIVGPLDLSSAELNTPLLLQRCLLQDGLDLSSSRVKGSIRILECRSLGSLNFTSSEVRGNLKVSGSMLDPGGRGPALLADGADISGALFVDNGSETTAGLRMIACNVGGNLVLTGSRIGNVKTQWSVLAEGLRVERALLINRGFSASGTLVLTSSYVGDLDLGGAEIRNDPEDPYSVLAQGIRVKGNFYAGGLATQSHLLLDTVDITGSTSLSGAEIGGRDGGISAQQSEFRGSLDLSHARVRGTVNLAGATVEGSLNLEYSSLQGEGCSFYGDNLRVGSEVRGSNLSTAGMIRLVNAVVAGQALLGFSTIGRDEESAISVLAVRFRAEAGASFQSSRLTGALVLAGGEFNSQVNMMGVRVGPAVKKGQAVGYSLYAQSLQVTSGGLFVNEAVVDGAVSVQGAKISGRFTLRDSSLGGYSPAQLGGAEHASLEAEGLKCDSDLDLRALRTANPVNLSLARVAGSLVIDTESLAMSAGLCVSLILRSAHFGNIDANFSGIRSCKGRRSRARFVDLDLCKYDSRPSDIGAGFKEWLDVLRWGAVGYQARAYQQFAITQKATGHDAEAATVYIQQNEHRRKDMLSNRPSDGERSRGIATRLTSLGMTIYRIALGYGYRPLRAVSTLIGLICLALALVFTTAALQSDTERILARTATVGSHESACASVELVGVGLRIALPLISNLGQGSCTVDTKPWGAGLFASIAFVIQVAAWILGALVVASAARALRRSA